MVTAPVQKSVINDAGIAFTGHTEYLAARTGAPLPVMMLTAGQLRVALATTHLPLRGGQRCADHRRRCCQQVLAIARARPAALVGHPRPAHRRVRPEPARRRKRPPGRRGDHASSGPAMRRMRAAGIDVEGPLPADTVFVPQHARALRRGAGHVPRPGSAGAQARRLRARGERHARPAHRCAPRSITARRSTSPAPAAPTPAASPRRSSSRARLAAQRCERRTRRAPAAARKRFGQHFLHDPAVIERIVARARSAAPATAWSRSAPAAARSPAAAGGTPASSMRSRSTATWPRALRARLRRRRALRAARGRRARVRLRASSPRSAAAGCASSATCPTTSPPRCCSACSAAGDVIIDLHVMLQREVVARMAARSRQRRLRAPDRDAGPAGRGRSACSRSDRAPSSRRRGSGRRWCA